MSDTPILNADKYKEAALNEAIKRCNTNHEAQMKAKETDPKTEVKPDWAGSDKIRQNTFFKEAEQAVVEGSAKNAKGESLYKKAEAHEMPFTYEGDMPIFMKYMVRHSKDGINGKDKSALVPWNSFIQDIRNDCAESLKKVSKQKRWYKTGTFSTLFIDDEAFIVCYAHNLVKNVKKQFQIRDKDNKVTGYKDDLGWVKDFTFPKPTKPKPAKAVKEYKGLLGFKAESKEDKEKLENDLKAYLDAKPFELNSK